MEEEVNPPYHVFINRGGPDVKRTYTSLIYHALSKHGLRMFPDKEELQVGDSLTPAIEYAIRSSSVRIAIFSKTFAQFPRCLNVLLGMLDSHSTSSKIIPIFCDIQPWELRYVDKGAYAGAFQDHRNNGMVTIEQVDSWIRALNKVSEISGVVISTEEDDLGERLDEIVGTVLKMVPKGQVDVCRYPVGLDQEAERLDQSRLRGINTVGIVGDRGSGKTTLVSHVYNSKLSEFERCCFLSVRKKELAYSQQTLLRELLRDPKICIDNRRKGMRMLKDRLQGLRVLIVFDDIDSKDQIRNLLFVKDIVENGSLILVTSRHKTLLASNGIETYDVKPLDAKDAQELVCLHAFGHREPPHELQDMVKELDVGMWPGLPLALVVLGEELRNERDPRKWKQRLESLRQQLPSNVLKQIQIWWRGFWMDCLPTLCQKCPVELESRDIIRRRAIRVRITCNPENCLLQQCC